MAELHLLDYLVVIALMVGSLAIGVYYAWTDRKRTNEDFLMGGRSMSVFPVVLSLIASFMSPISVLGVPAEIYSRGAQFFMSILASFVASFVAAEVFLPMYYRLKLTSVNTYIYERFQSHLLVAVASLSISFSMIPWLGVVLFSPSLVLMTVTNLSTLSCILITGVVVTIYTSIGGIKAVVWTDVLQYTLMVAGLLAVLIKGLIKVGGFAEVWKRSVEGGRIEFFNFEFNVYMSNNFWTVVFGTIVVWAGSYSTSQMLVQRTCTLPSIKKAKQVVYFAMPGFQIMILTMCFIGIMIYANYYKCDPLTSNQIKRIDEIVPYFVIDVLGDIPGLSGLFVACVCSASLSTLSSGLNAIAALLWEDIFVKLLPNTSPNKAVLITKLLAASVGAVCVLMAFLASEIGTIFEASFALSGAPIGPIFATFALGLFLPFINANGALVGLLFGQFCCIIINVGAIMNKYKKGILLSSTEECDSNIFINSTIPLIPLSNLTNYQIPNHEPEGFNHIFHLSHYMVPTVGFLATAVAAIIVSLITGCNRDRKVNPNLLNGAVVKILKLEANNEKEVNGKQEMRAFI